MWIEGLIHKDFATLMEKAGYEFDWKIEDEAQLKVAREKGLDVPETLDESENYVKFYVDSDIETMFSAYTLLSYIQDDMLPTLIGMNHPEVKKALEDKLNEN